VFAPVAETARHPSVDHAIEACLRAATRPGAGTQDIFDVAARAPDKLPAAPPR
jgi:hypothetical protein